jgi:glycosyltransferase involved in cell wall biosynthesis
VKILLVNDYATPRGGAELATLGLRDGLRQAGHDARIFSSSARESMESGFADYECMGTLSRWRTLLQTINPWAYLALRRVIADFRPDVVHVRMFLTQLSPLILPLLRDVPTLYHAVWYRAVCPLGTKILPDGAACRAPAGIVCYRNHCLPIRDWFPLMLQMRLWRRWRHVFRAIVANSEATRRYLVAEGIEPVQVIWNGVAMQGPRPPLSPTPVVVCVGRLVREKGVDVLVRAFVNVIASIPGAQLVIIGGGPEERRLGELIAEMGLSAHVSMLGRLPRSETERHCARAWVQVVPSRWAEPFGLVAAEAMMRGTAVVASASGALTEIVADGQTGFLVRPDDPAALAEILRRLLSRPELAEEIGMAGRTFAREYLDQATQVSRFVELYRALSDAQAARVAGR